MKMTIKMKKKYKTIFLNNRSIKMVQIGFWFAKIHEKLMEIKIKKWAQNEKTKVEKMQTASRKRKV